MVIQRAYKTEIKPNDEQHLALLRHCGAARWAFNWGLARKIRYYKLTGKTVSSATLDTHLRKLKARLPELAWLDEISSHTRQQALINLDAAYKNFFRRVKGGKKGKDVGFPRFKSRHHGIGSATFFSFRFESGHVNLSRTGRVKLAESNYIPVGKYGDNGAVKMRGVRVTERAGRWYVSVQVEMSIVDVDTAGKPALGVDVGIKSLAVVSDGANDSVFENPRALGRATRKLKRAQRALSRRVKGSANRLKAKSRLAKIHSRIANIRSDATHKATSIITRNSSAIVIESLNVRGMMANHRISRAASDANMAEFLRQIRYKADWNGATVIEADKWMPSSKTCSACGSVKKDLTLSDRLYVCECCGLEIDRDVNAARNLAKLAGSYSESVNACGGESSATGSLVVVLPCETGTQTVGAK